MTTMQIHLQDALRDQLAKRAAESDFADIETYVDSLLRTDAGQDAIAADEAMQSLLLNRIESGDGVEMTRAFEKQFRHEIATRRSGSGNAK